MTAPSDTKAVTTVRHRGPLFAVETIAREVDGRRIERDVIRHPGAVVIVPCLDDERLVLIRNRRIAVGDTLLELPAGTMEAGEEPAATAVRELEEETGYRAESVIRLGGFFTSPGFLDEWIEVFVARGLVRGPARPDHGEEIEVLELTRAAAWAAVDGGTLRDAKTIAALALLERHERSRAGATS